MLQNKLFHRLKAFLYAAIAGLQFNVGGQLGGNEILALIDSFSLTKWKNLYRDIPDIKRINIAYIVMFIFQVISDIVNHSDSHDYIRGWAAIIMSIITLNFLAKVLLKSFDSIIYYLIGATISLVIFKSREDFSFDNFDTNTGSFKLFIVPILINVLLLVFCSIIKKSKTAIVALFIFSGLFFMMFDARSLGVFFIIAGLIYLFKEHLINYNRQKAAVFLIFFLLVFQGLYILYVKEVVSGKIGGEHTQTELKRVNYSYNPIYLLFTGRTEFFVAIKAIQDEPIIGHGSWAPDPTGKYTAMTILLQGENTDIKELLKTGTLIIPSHSILLGTWMTMGLGGFIAILFIFFLFLKRCFYLLSNKDIIDSKYFPILVYYILVAFWTFLFSPLPHIKDTLPIYIAFVIVSYQKVQDQKLILQNNKK